MCDHGRLNTFQHVNSPERLDGPMVRKGGTLMRVGWDEAITTAASSLKSYKKSEVAGIASSSATNEDNYLFAKLMRDVIGTKLVDVVPHIVEGDDDKLLIRADKTPNAAGVTIVGAAAQPPTLPEILHGIASGTIKALYVMEEDIAALPEFAKVLGKLELLIVHSPLRTATTDRAHIVLSCSTWAEKNGTFVNFQRRLQRIRPAVATLEQDRALDGFAMSRWDTFAAPNDRWGKPVKKDARPSWRIAAAVAFALGAKRRYNSAEDVFKEMSEKIPVLKGLSYRTIGNRGLSLHSANANVGTTVPA
jgi:NADH-quinone oxidoreductase subunit G